jgi:glyoxylase-like metal-dependent hydrolase (beta-lactamase superfamily II)
MIEIVPYNDTVTCIKTATEQNGNAIMWVYAYLIEDALLDAGCKNAEDELRDFAKTRDIKRIYLSHSHEDHVGGYSAFLPDATVFARPSAFEILQNPPDFGDFFDYVWGRPKPMKSIEPMPDEFSIGAFHIEVIPVPGHGTDMIAFYEPEKRWFFSADAVPLPSRKKIAQIDENIPQIIATLEMVEKMKIDVLFDGHRGPIESPKEHIEVRINHLKEMQEKVKRLHDSGKTINEIIDELGIESPWYLDLTEGRFGLDYFVRSLLFDKVQ